MFPVIEHINDVLPYIEDHPNFIVVDKPPFTIITYVCMDETTFPNLSEGYAAQIRRECRGLVFDSETGKIVARRFHKFFNINERDETRFDNIDWNQPHEIYEKLDGSMVTPLPIERNDQGRLVFRWATKMGITDTSMNAEVYVAQHRTYNKLAEDLFEIGYTPIFEWCSNKDKIVINHPEDRLVWLAARHNTSGEYLPYERMLKIAPLYDIPVVQRYNINKNPKQLLEYIRSLDDQEGIVINLQDSGPYLAKVKSEWYCQLHKAKELISNERNVIQMILDNNVDDVKPLLNQEMREKMTSFEQHIHQTINVFMERVLLEGAAVIKEFPDRKDFALSQRRLDMDPLMQSIMFSLRDTELPELLQQKPWQDVIVDPAYQRLYQHVYNKFVYNNLTNKSKCQDAKQLIGIKDLDKM